MSGAHRTDHAPRLVLASTSPRRLLLLREAGFAPHAMHPGVDDGQLRPGSTPAAHWTCALAYLKARVCADRLDTEHGSPIVLGADTVVIKHATIIGQPRDRDDAERILRLLRAGSHEVATGVALLNTVGGTRSIWCDVARVTVGDIPDDELQRYLDSGQWAGKAGAYNLGERISAGWPIACEGDPGTVMGLPMRRLGQVLDRLGVARELGPVSRGALA